MSKLEELVYKLAEPIAGQIGCEIIEAEYKKEGADYFLRVYLDREEGSVDLDACEYVSKRLSDALDREDPIPEAYYLEVCSPGIDRILKRDKDFVRFAGRKVDVKLYAAKDGMKEFSGILVGKQADTVSVEVGERTMEFKPEEIAYIRLAVEF